MDPGYTQATYSRNETIGLPNWSFVSLTASVTTTCRTEQYDETYTFLTSVVETFLSERIEGVARALNLWAGLPTTIVDQGTKDSIVPQGLDLSNTECMFSMKETVGLPNKAKIEIFAASKKSPSLGGELAMLESAGESVQTQMRDKRDVVMAKPRPWTATP